MRSTTWLLLVVLTICLSCCVCGVLTIGDPLSVNVVGTISSSDGATIEAPVVIFSHSPEVMLSDCYFEGDCVVIIPSREDSEPPVFHFNALFETLVDLKDLHIFVRSDSHTLYSGKVEEMRQSRTEHLEITLQPKE